MNQSRGYRILIADDEKSVRFVLKELLTREGCQVDEAVDGEQAVEMARRNGYDLYLLDMKMPRMNGMDALVRIRGLYPDAMMIMITAFGSQAHSLDALKAGAYDYFSKPFNIEELRLVLLRALNKHDLNRKLKKLEQQAASERSNVGGMIGGGRTLKQVCQMIDRAAEHDVTVLITGESGTGKELVARALHERSPRHDGPFITVNCAAIPEPLLESELFGHEKGAFTGASHAKPGRFEMADGGTLLLDEIGEMPFALQAKLLRVLQQREIERVGSTRTRKVDIRVVASTNCDLAEMVGAGSFREDLYFRINVIPIHLPPLRDRLEDLPELVQHFISEYNARFGKRVEILTPKAMKQLEQYDWPGNIRELENTIQRAMVMTAGNRIDLDAFPSNIIQTDAPRDDCGIHPVQNVNLLDVRQDGLNITLSDHIDAIVMAEEIRMIEWALQKAAGRRQESADLLKISRKSLHNKMQKYGLFDNAQS
jgi:two-component system response regulator AtoC